MKNVGLICFLFLFNMVSMAQNHASEVGVILDNDLFTSTVNDKYYTNGFEIYYRYLTPKKSKIY